MDSDGFYTTRGGIAWPWFWLPNLINAYAISSPPYFQWTETESLDCFVTLSSSLNSWYICGFSVESKHAFYTPYYWCGWKGLMMIGGQSCGHCKALLLKVQSGECTFCFDRDHTTVHIWHHLKSVSFPVRCCVTQFHFCQEFLLNTLHAYFHI